MSETIWESKLDDIYDCKVIRLGERTGRLIVTNTSNGSVLLEQDVGLSYGAVFGPDSEDVANWHDLCVGAVDSQ